LLAVLLFAVALQSQLRDGSIDSGISDVLLFGNGQLYFAETGIAVDYSAYLSYGFWIALAAATIMFFAFRKKPAESNMITQSGTPQT
jgi:hypothetical protein